MVAVYWHSNPDYSPDAAFLLRYWYAGNTHHSPGGFFTRKRIILNATWIFLFIAGASILFAAHWAFGITALLVYWLGLPALITPIFKRYMLGSWDDHKHILEKQGYTKDNYLNGDWWKKVTP